MKEIINKLLKDGILDKKKLLTTKYKSVGIADQEALLLLNIIEKDDSKKITVNSISKKLDISKNETEELLGSLIKSKLVNVKHTKAGIVFDLTAMFEKLAALYYPPEDLDPMETKVNWLINQLKLKNTPVVKKQLGEWIQNGGWGRLLSITEGLSKLQLEVVEYTTLKKLYLNDSKEKSATLKNLKNILNINWLES